MQIVAAQQVGASWTGAADCSGVTEVLRRAAGLLRLEVAELLAPFITQKARVSE